MEQRIAELVEQMQGQGQSLKAGKVDDKHGDTEERGPQKVKSEEEAESIPKLQSQLK